MNELWMFHLKVGVSLALLLVLYRLLIHQETHFTWSRAYLILSILVSLALPVLHFTSPILGKAAMQIGFLRTHFAPAPMTAIDMRGQIGPIPVETGIDWMRLLLVVYAAGVLVFGLRFLFHMFSLLRLILNHGIHKAPGYYLVWTDHEYSPFSFLNIIFINRKYLLDKSFQRIIAHERVHIRQGHTLDLFLAELLIIFQWMNPFVWPYKRYLKETHEFLADAGVIAQGCDAAAYQMLVVEQAVGIPLFGFSSSFHHTQVKRRIHMMTRSHSKPWARLKGLMFIPITALLLAAFAVPKSIRASVSAEPLPVAFAAGLKDSLDQKKIAEFEDQERKKAKLLVEQKEAQVVHENRMAELEDRHVVLSKTMEQLEKEKRWLSEKKANAAQTDDELKFIAEKEMALKDKMIDLEQEQKAIKLKSLELAKEREFAVQQSNATHKEKISALEDELKKVHMSIDQLKKDHELLAKKRETVIKTGQSPYEIDNKIARIKYEIEVNQKQSQVLKIKLEKMK